MDNPDQRIQEDVASFTGYSLNLVETIVNTILSLVRYGYFRDKWFSLSGCVMQTNTYVLHYTIRSYSVILYTIMPELFITIILFASIGTVMTVLVGKGQILLRCVSNYLHCAI